AWATCAWLREGGPTVDRGIAIGAKTGVPGHGALSDTAGLKRARDYIGAMWAHVEKGVKEGKGVDEIEKTFDATPYGLKGMMGFSSAEKNIEAAYREAT